MSSVTGDGGSFSSGTNIEEEDAHQQSQALHGTPLATGAIFSDSSASLLQLPTAKKRRNLPGTPDPNAEVIALSPKTLMATNRFVCEICHKGFQREQNLQLHRRGHNLPWKLRQRSAAEGRKRRVYVCPEATCVHHSPGRALGDLTGIKKHYCRKHGEKKWKCERCSKRYAVQSDWKAHSKTCGTKEYKCDCGTIFSRRDSFITHRAFCDALAQENTQFAQHCMAANGANLAMMPVGHDDIPVPAAASFSFDCDAGIQPPKALSDHSVPAALAFPSATVPAPSVFGPMVFDADVARLVAPSSMHTSATALLQRAAEIGATASRNGVACPATMMAGSDRAAAAGPYSRLEAPWPFGGNELMREVTVDFLGLDGAEEEEMARGRGMKFLQQLSDHGPSSMDKVEVMWNEAA